MKHYARKLTEEINNIIKGEERAVWAGAIQMAVERALARPEQVCAQYIADKAALKNGRESIVDGCLQLQIEAVREVQDRITGEREDAETQIRRYWADALGKWVTIPEDEA